MNKKLYTVGMIGILYIVIIIGLVIFNSCGMTGGGLVTKELSCTIDGAVMTCPDGSTYDISQLQGADGTPGQSIVGPKGETGMDGRTSLINTERVSSPMCSPAMGTLVQVGLDVNDNNLLDWQEVSSVDMICDGKDGSDSPPTQYTFTGVLDPCGDATGIVDEILFKMANGQILCSFSNNTGGDFTRLAILVAGDYVTTDRSGCFFTVTEDNKIINEHY